MENVYLSIIEAKMETIHLNIGTPDLEFRVHSILAKSILSYREICSFCFGSHLY